MLLIQLVNEGYKGYGTVLRKRVNRVVFVVVVKGYSKQLYVQYICTGPCVVLFREYHLYGNLRLFLAIFAVADTNVSHQQKKVGRKN